MVLAGQDKQACRWYKISSQALAHMRKLVMDQKSTEKPHPAVANVHTDSPMPIRRKGLNLHPDIVDQIIIENPGNEQGK
jgi:hypothetical protein